MAWWTCHVRWCRSDPPRLTHQLQAFHGLAEFARSWDACGAVVHATSIPDFRALVFLIWPRTRFF
jgi:hypothetical protein